METNNNEEIKRCLSGLTKIGKNRGENDKNFRNENAKLKSNECDNCTISPTINKVLEIGGSAKAVRKVAEIDHA